MCVCVCVCAYQWRRTEDARRLHDAAEVRLTDSIKGQVARQKRRVAPEKASRPVLPRGCGRIDVRQRIRVWVEHVMQLPAVHHAQEALHVQAGNRADEGKQSSGRR